MSSENAPSPALSAGRRRRRNFLWGRLSIRFKLLAMLLAVSFFAYRSSSEIDQRKEAVEVARAQTESSSTRPVTSSIAARA